MIIVRLMGGLGNQMFQYAFGRCLSERNNSEVKLDTSSFPERTPANGSYVVRNYDLDVFDISPQFATDIEISSLSKRTSMPLLDRLLNKALGYKDSVVLEPHFHFSPIVHESPDNRYLIGYWQSPKYFAEIESSIRREFSFREPPSVEAQRMLEQIEGVTSICVNVRRGDFVTNPFHGSYGIDYFQAADAVLKERIADYQYFVFSDDIEWCEANLEFDVPSTFVSHEYAGSKFEDYLRLMSACKHFVIPNSSFAWWAVWFNQDPEKIVIAPKAWFQDPKFDTRDLIPETWIRL